MFVVFDAKKYSASKLLVMRGYSKELLLGDVLAEMKVDIFQELQRAINVDSKIKDILAAIRATGFNVCLHTFNAVFEEEIEQARNGIYEPCAEKLVFYVNRFVDLVSGDW